MPHPCLKFSLMVAWGISLVALAASPALVAAPPPLPPAIAAIVESPEFKQAHFGLLVVDAKSGEVLVERDADRLFIPASVAKLFTTAAALADLGPQFVFETPVYATARVNDQGVLHGDLIVVASGDLTLGGRNDPAGRISFTNSDHTYASFAGRAELTKPDPLAGLDAIASQLRAAGLKKLQGELIIDDRLFPAFHSSGSGPEDVTPVMLNDNLIDFTITPTTPGALAKIAWRPASSAIIVDAQVTTGTTDAKSELTLEPASSSGHAAAWTYILRGQIAAGSGPRIEIAEVPDPTRHLRACLIDALRRAQIEVSASTLTCNPRRRLPDAGQYPAMTKLANFVSPPLAENLRLILKVSHNLHASALPMLLAVRHGGTTLDEGLAREHDALAKLGVDVDTIALTGGAGGGRLEYLSPRATVQLLVAMSKRDDFPVYREALPILGVDGTLHDTVDATSPAKGKVYAKTGTLVWQNPFTGRLLCTSKSLAGYIERDGRLFAFAFFLNHVHLDSNHDAFKLGKKLARLCEIVVEGK